MTEKGFSSKHIALKVEVLQARKIYFLQARPCIIQRGSFTCWGSEGVKKRKEKYNLTCNGQIVADLVCRFLLVILNEAARLALCIPYVPNRYVIAHIVSQNNVHCCTGLRRLSARVVRYRRCQFRRNLSDPPEGVRRMRRPGPHANELVSRPDQLYHQRPHHNYHPHHNQSQTKPVGQIQSVLLFV